MNKYRIRITNWHKKFVVEERYVSPQVRSKLIAAAFALMGIGLAFFIALIIQVTMNTGIVHQDHLVASWFVQHRNPNITPIMIVLATVFGPIYLPIILLIVIIVWIITAKHVWRPLLLAGFMILGVIIVQVLAHIVGRARPPIDLMLLGADHTFSFPSGHVMGVSDFFLITSYLLISRNPTRRRISIGIIVTLFAIGIQIISRLYLGYHWMSDTLTSVSLALVMLSLVVLIDTWRTVRIPGERIKGEYSKPQTDQT